MTSQRKKTAPSTQKRSRSAPTSRNGLIAKEKTKKQSAKRRTVLDNRFHRTDLCFSRAVPTTAEANHAHVTAERGNERHRVGCKRELDGGALPPELPPRLSRLRTKSAAGMAFSRFLTERTFTAASPVPRV